MDRNEKKNSFRNVQNSRGNDREAKKYKRAFHITLAVAVVLAATTGGLGFTTYRLSRDTENSGGNEENVVVIGGEDETKTEATPEDGKVTVTPGKTQTSEATEVPEETVIPEASVTTEPEKNKAQAIVVTVTNSLGRDIKTIDIREATSSTDDSDDTWNPDLWKMTQPLATGDSEEYSVNLDGLTGDSFDICVNKNDDEGKYYFRNLPLKSIKEIELKLDNGQSDLPYADYKEDESGEVVSTLEEVKKRNNGGEF